MDSRWEHLDMVSNQAWCGMFPTAWTQATMPECRAGGMHKWRSGTIEADEQVATPLMVRHRINLISICDKCLTRRLHMESKKDTSRKFNRYVRYDEWAVWWVAAVEYMWIQQQGGGMSVR